MATTKRSKFKRILLSTGLVLVLSGVGVVVYFKKREVPITIQTEKVSRRNLTELVVATGKIQPVVQVVINPEVSGEIIELPVKEGQLVKKGDLLVRIKPDNYIARRNSAEASYKSALAARNQAQAELLKAELEFKRNQELFNGKLVSESIILDFKTAYEVAKLRLETAVHQADQAKAALAREEDDLAKTTIYSPIDGTVTRLKSQLGERVLGTSFNVGTEIMTVANLDDMEARVDIGEIDIVLIAIGQTARLEVEAFREQKFAGTVTEIANASKGLAVENRMSGGGGGGQPQEATKFEVKIRIKEKEIFRPGMTVTAETETRYRTNVLTVPIQSVTTRLPKEGAKSDGKAKRVEVASASTSAADMPSGRAASKKQNEKPKPIEVVFINDHGKAKMIKVKPGISDDAYYEIVEGLEEGQEVISGGYKAISRELEDGKKVKLGSPKSEKAKEKK